MKIVRIVRAISLSLLICSASYAQNAARIDDATSGGGHIVSGSPTVRVNSLLATRVGDNIVTPRFVGPLACGGGLILPPGSTTVFINSKPAARVGDQATTVCGPETIVGGSPNVFIGD